MRLYVPTKAEAGFLLGAPTEFRGYAVVRDSLPPAVLLERGRDCLSSGWRMPRLFIDEQRREVVGSACFKSEPREGKVEIGYGVAAARRSRGHATAGVSLLVAEAFEVSEVIMVLAAASPNNAASRRVLQKCGFVICGAGVDEEEGPVELWARSRAATEA